MTISKLFEFYSKMYGIRLFDDYCLELKMRDIVMDGFHPYRGEEAVAVGVSDCLRTDDYVISNHRPQGHAIAKGSSYKAVFAELCGRVGGMSDGIGGPMQFIDYEHNFYCGSIVGSGMTIAAGVAMAMKREGKGRVCICYFGDGASNTGSFHEAMNLASIWKLPVVYILENNQYAEAMPVAEFVSAYPISKRGVGYGIPSVTIDGNDVTAVAETIAEAVLAAREGAGPQFIECVTYRTRGHYGGDPEQTYRSKSEVDEWEKPDKDPISRLELVLRSKGVTTSEIEALRETVKTVVTDARDSALEMPHPTVDEATAFVMLDINNNRSGKD
jgi:Pyruvate/2-oxoglutarate dehydrogenase complex, dehydrogenase (E1) component, eukaryotic type, alpha subunit